MVINFSFFDLVLNLGIAFLKSSWLNSSKDTDLVIYNLV